MKWLVHKQPLELLERISQNRDKPMRKVSKGVYGGPGGPFRTMRILESQDFIELKIEGRKKIATITRRGLKLLKNYRRLKELIDDNKIQNN